MQSGPIAFITQSCRAEVMDRSIVNCRRKSVVISYHITTQVCRIDTTSAVKPINISQASTAIFQQSAANDFIALSAHLSQSFIHHNTVLQSVSVRRHMKLICARQMTI